ncbi:MauE/DoxX family redox-associated membrane protein [Propionibacteriaceae bacterium Y1700]|uniref:MauE/DoxX family redox-associated membrane protein n=1 Tax=Microlunatus sp. Y1700 TaxID=3418487 RepID=UPI003DA78AEE
MSPAAALAPDAPAARWTRAQPWLSLVVRLALAAVLIIAGALKVADPQQAVRAVAAYELLPAAITPIVGFALPWLEIALAALLLCGFLTRGAAVATGVLMVVFIAGVASAWARGLSIDCGCFGGGGQVAAGETAYLSEILRDLGFIAMAAFLTIWPRSTLSLDARYADPA